MNAHVPAGKPGAGRVAVAVVTGIDEYQKRLLDGMHQVFSENWMPLIVHANDPYIRGVPASLVRLLREGNPLGVVTSASNAPGEEADLAGLLAAMGIPAVHIGQHVPGATCIRGDNVTGMRALMAHLLDHCGARRPVLIRGVVHQPDSIIREQVFREEMDRRGLPVDENLIINGEFGHDIAYRAMRLVLRTRRDLDAVVAANDPSALGALGALTDEGLRVPEDVLVTGFDNDHAASLNWPGLTTVDQQLEEQGRIAAQVLISQMRGEPPMGEVVVPSRLVVRGSTVAQVITKGGFDAAVSMARGAQAQLAAQDAVLGMNRVLIQCRTLDEVVRALASRLDRLGIGQCFLAIFQSPHDPGNLVMSNPDHAKLVLDYRDGKVQPLSGEVFPTYRLLPEDSRTAISSRSMLVLQPLSVLDRDLGYVLFEQTRGPATVTEVLRMDLSRTLDGVASTQGLEDHAATLERLVARRTAELESANAELQRSVLLDGLTRIANRVAFGRHLEQYWRALARTGDELAVLMIDVDLFKPFNDRYGHLVGDEALRTVAQALQDAVRDGRDLACRYGGEEFAMVLPEAGRAEAMAVAERFRALLAEAAVPHQASSVSSVVTASVGIAVDRASPAAGPFVLVEAADRALYRAKALGRDRISVADPPASAPADPPASAADSPVPRPRTSPAGDVALRDC